MFRKKWVVLLCTSAYTLLTMQQLHAQLTLDALRSVVRSEISEKNVPTVKPSITRQGSTLHVNLGGAILFGPEEDFNAVEEMFKVEILRRHIQNSPSQRQFWEPVLRQVEGVIDQELRYRQGTRSVNQKVIKRFSSQIDDIYNRTIENYARSRGLTVNWEGVLGVSEFKIRFITKSDSPQDVWYIPTTRYKLQVHMNQQVDFIRTQSFKRFDIEAGNYYVSLDGVNPLRGIYEIKEPGDYRVNND